MTRGTSAARRGLMVGALAGLWVALGDFGALWLWLPLPRDRAWLLVRLIATLVPIGGLLGAALAAAQRSVVAGLGPRRARLWPLPFTVLALGPLFWLADRLCAGGAMQKLAARYPIALALRVVLPLALLATLALAQRAARAIGARPARALPASAALLSLAVLLGKLNQWLLPNLYDYLHGLLALLVWALAALGLALLAWRVPRTARLGGLLDRPWLARLSGLCLALVALANATTLDRNLNVRVAMFDARSPTSRALLMLSDPLLRRLEAAPERRARTAVAPRRGEALPASAPGAHVVLITIDALRADHLGSYGYARPVSPALDALAARGVRFDRAYAQAPHSSYSLSALHTSEYVHEVVELGRALPATTLARALTEHGYHTAAFFTDGIFHTEGEKLAALRDSAFGFALFDHTNREAEAQTDRVLAEADRIARRGEPPSFLWVHYFDVHEPYQETTFGSSEMDRYDSEILHVDRELARLLRALEARFERPLVVAITADHGEEFREHGGVYHGSTLYDEQTRVPLLLAVPSIDPAVVHAPVEVVDVAPTLLAAVGAPIPESMQGRDLRGLLSGQPAAEAVFSAVLTKRMALRWPLKLIADLRFGLYELYDLERDPEERKNLAADRPGELEALRALVYGWLDGIDARTGPQGAEPGRDGPEAAWQRALHLGRLGDRRAVAPTTALLLDRDAPVSLRVEAGQNLAKLADPSALPALTEALATEPAEVAHEAAIAIGRMYDPRAQEALRRLVQVEDPYVRARAAVSLGRLRDRAAVPALIDALWVAPTQYEREEAVRWLGRIGDPAAVEPLLSLLPEFGLRYLLAVALGQIGDPRAFPALADMLAWESRTNIRDEVVRGLGLLGDPRAIPLLVDVLAREPALKNTAESLVRLDAPARGALGGLDVGPDARGLRGFGDCVAGPLQHDWDYLERTHCTSTSPQLVLRLPLPHGVRAHDGVLVLRARRADAPEHARCAVRIGSAPPAALDATGAFTEQRIELPASALSAAHALLEITCDAPVRLTLDHALIAPRAAAQAAER